MVYTSAAVSAGGKGTIGDLVGFHTAGGVRFVVNESGMVDVPVEEQMEGTGYVSPWYNHIYDIDSNPCHISFTVRKWEENKGWD